VTMGFAENVILNAIVTNLVMRVAFVAIHLSLAPARYAAEEQSNMGDVMNRVNLIGVWAIIQTHHVAMKMKEHVYVTLPMSIVVCRDK